MSGYSWRVPLTVYGDLTIQGSAELGEAGARLGEPVSFHWSVWWNLLALAPVCLVLALLFMPGNLNGRAWLIVIPLAVCAGLPTLVGSLLPEATVVTTVITSLVVAMTALWLVSGWLTHQSSVTVVLAALAIFIALGAVSGLAESGTVFDPSALRSMAAHAVWGGAFVAAMAAAAALCRKSYHPGKLVLWFFLVGMSILLIVCLAATVVGAIFYMGEFGDPRMMIGVIIAGVAGSVFLAMLTGAFVWGPFVVLALTNRVYRERLHAILRLPGMQQENPPPLPMR